MVSLFCIFFFMITVYFIRESDTKDIDVYYFCNKASVISGIVAIAFLVWVLILINQVGTRHTIDNKIAMLEEENASIEESIDVIVRSYMDSEVDTYGELKDKDAINLVSLFPELKSDALVQEQIQVYVANNDKINQLREKKIDLSKLKWMLYFGR